MQLSSSIAFYFLSVIFFSYNGNYSSAIKINIVNNKGISIDESNGASGVYRPAINNEIPSKTSSRFRVEILNAPLHPSLRVTVVSIDPVTGIVRDKIKKIKTERDQQGKVVTSWLVAVTNNDDKHASLMKPHAIVAEIGDIIEARVRLGGKKAIRTSCPVAMPSNSNAPMSIKKVPINIVFLRNASTGKPVIGANDNFAKKVIKHKIKILNEVLAQCYLWVGQPADVKVVIKSPPKPSMLVVGEKAGRASLGGEVRILIDKKKLGPWKIGAEYTPIETARMIMRHLVAAGYKAQIFENIPQPSMKFASADVVVKNKNDKLVTLESWSDNILYSGSQQSMTIGKVDLDNGLLFSDSKNILTATIEERTLIRLLRNSDNNIINVFVIDKFSGNQGSQQQGKAFIKNGDRSIGNVVIIDADAIVNDQQRYTFSHHVSRTLMGHFDKQKDDKLWLLMHPNANFATNGSRRITAAQCRKMRKKVDSLFTLP